MSEMEPQVKIIGPFLGPRGENGVEIFIALPHQAITHLTCKLLEKENEIASCECQVKENDIYKLFRFKFEELEKNKEYSYKFLSNGNSLDLEGGLIETDCCFKVLGEGSTEESFILMSCHNPFQIEEGSADEGWTVWEQLHNHLKKDDSVRLLVLGGDQVYNDDVEKEYLKKLKKNDSSIHTKAKKRFIAQYQKYWGNLYYRKILASTLSIAMWDDHDITDGWGSRPESFQAIIKRVDFKSNWLEFFKLARETFRNYQASRNPESIYKNAFSSFLDWGDKRFVLADFRSERNSRKNKLWTEEHKSKVLESIKNTSDQIKKVFFVSPVVALRTNFKTDKRLSVFSKCLFWLRKWEKNLSLPWKVILFFGGLVPFILVYFSSMSVEYFPSSNMNIVVDILISLLLQLVGLIAIVLPLIPLIPELPDLSDDMEDGLSSDSNMESLKEILEALVELGRKGKEVFILSGDIHIGGLTEIIDNRENPKVQMLQIVSSPIAYSPMPKVVSGLTTTSSEMVIRESSDKKRLFARNIFYLSKRNFAQIFPNKKDNAIAFHFEGHEFPVVFPKKFL